MSNKISISYEKRVEVDVEVDFTVVCGQCHEPLESDYDETDEILEVSPCKNCSGKKILTPEILEEVRAKFGEEVYQFLDLKRMLQE